MNACFLGKSKPWTAIALARKGDKLYTEQSVTKGAIEP